MRRVTDEEGRDSYLYHWIPLSRQDTLPKALVVSPTAAFNAQTSLLAEPKLVKEGLPCVEGMLGVRCLSLGGQSWLPWLKAGQDAAAI